MKYWLVSLLSLCLASTLFAQSANQPMTVGPLAVDPAAAIYVVVGDEPVNVRLTLNKGHRKEGDRVIVRAYDPDENLTYWQFVKPGQVRDALGPGDMEVYGIPLQIPVKPQPHELMYDTTLILKGKGVHQIRLVAGARNTVATLQFPKPVGYGISFQNGWFTPWDANLTKAYAYVPPHAQSLTLTGTPLTVHDAFGKKLLDANENTKRQDVDIKSHKTLLTFDLPSSDGFKFRASGFPVILCPTKEAANAIKASVIQMEDGTVVTHQFQTRIPGLLTELLKPENVGDAQALIKPLENYRDGYLANPSRNRYLLGHHAFMLGVADILRGQNVDPDSHWAGSLGDDQYGWQTRIDKPFPQNRWDTLGSIKGLYAGTSPGRSWPESLTHAYEIESSINPYHGKKELLYRVAAACLSDLMVLGEDENLRGVGADNTDYAGMMAFAVAQKTFPPYAHVAKHMSPQVREVWTEGLRRIVDRMYTENMVSCRNQSSHYLVAFEAFAQGSGLPRYEQLAREYAKRFRDEAHPSGYQIEQCGPDASYIGMTHWHEAVYYQMSKDPTILDALRDSYGFFNKTVAPEPGNTRMLGGFNFNHRVGDGFYFEQWGGAKGIVSEVLPEVGVWSRIGLSDEEQRQNDAQMITKALNNPPKSHHSNLNTARYLYYTDTPDTSAKFPAESETPFINNHNDELITVRQPGYYAVVYVGHPAPSDHYISTRHHYRMPYANDAENKPSNVNNRKVTPYVGGGMSLFWTPEYGSAIMSTNWSPVYRHGLMAQQNDDMRYWEDYFANDFKCNEKARLLIVDGKIENQPLEYKRTYRFNRESMDVTLELTATKDLNLKRLIEVFPYPMGQVKSNGVIVTASGQSQGQVSADQLQIADKAGNGIRIRFDGKQTLTFANPGLRRHSLQMCRVELSLPEKWKSGQTHSLKYTLHPISPAHN